MAAGTSASVENAAKPTLEPEYNALASLSDAENSSHTDVEQSPTANETIPNRAGADPSEIKATRITHRHIVVLSDGTGNSAASLFKTNVRRLYEALDLADPQFPRRPRQFAFYDDGVGTSSFRPAALLGGAIGLGLARNVRDLYAFVCRTYHDPNDKIYAFGFSRGAFTIRVLIGLIADQGLVPYDGNEANLNRDVAKAYRRYRRKYKTKARQWFDTLTHKADQHSGANNNSKIGPKVEFVGLWDTVDAYGLPIDELTRAVDLFLWPLTMPDYTLSEKVKYARHAMSLDDERNTFHPRLWNEDDSTGDRISQVWFAGVHANVGGGYADDSLAYVSLKWMMDEATKRGLRFSEHIRERYEVLQDENGPIYDSRHGLGGYYRYNPRRVEGLCDSSDVHVSRRPRIHESVLRRIKVAQDGYAPVAVPPDFDVVKIKGNILTIAEYLKSFRPSRLNKIKSTSFRDRYECVREHVWNWVWWRRVAYYFTLATTLLLAAFPLIWPALPKGACESRLCFVANAIDWTTILLPGFTSTWTDAFRSQPDIFLLLASLTAGGLWAGGRLQQRVRDAMRSVWYSIPELNPRSTTPGWAAKPVPPGPLNRFVEWVREHPAYKAVFRALTRWLMPGAFLLALCYLALALISQTFFAVRSSWGGVCASAGEPKPVTGRVAGVPFQTAALCSSTGLALEKGATYRLRIAIPVNDPWRDRGPWTEDAIPAGPNGVHPKNVSFPMSAGVPLRRSLAQPWFKPIARIGSTGSDEYPLDPDPALAPRDDSAGQVFEARIVARSKGELFLYVNDAVLDLFPGLTSLFYARNQGSGSVTVELLAPPPEPEPAAPVGTQ